MIRRLATGRPRHEDIFVLAEISAPGTKEGEADGLEGERGARRAEKLLGKHLYYMDRSGESRGALPGLARPRWRGWGPRRRATCGVQVSAALFRFVKYGRKSGPQTALRATTVVQGPLCPSLLRCF